jgi:hypothetical protein
MLKQHAVTLHHVNSGDNNMFHLMDDVMRVLAKQKTQLRGDLHFTMKIA